MGPAESRLAFLARIAGLPVDEQERELAKREEHWVHVFAEHIRTPFSLRDHAMASAALRSAAAGIESLYARTVAGWRKAEG